MLRRSLSVLGLSAAQRTYRPEDFNRVNEEGEYVTSVIKMDHPHREQYVTIVPLPRFGYIQYFEDWVYQPYIKDALVAGCVESYHPANTIVPEMRIARGGHEGHDFYRMKRTPDPVSVGIERHTFQTRMRNLGMSWFAYALKPTPLRDRKHPYIVKGIHKILGARYSSHPPESEQNHVFIVPLSFMSTTMNTMKDLGFKEAESIVIPYGKKETVDQMYKEGLVGDFFWFGYIYFLIFGASQGIFRLWYKQYRHWVRAKILQEGENPSDYGYGEEDDEDLLVWPNPIRRQLEEEKAKAAAAAAAAGHVAKAE